MLQKPTQRCRSYGAKNPYRLLLQRYRSYGAVKPSCYGMAVKRKRKEKKKKRKEKEKKRKEKEKKRKETEKKQKRKRKNMGKMPTLHMGETPTLRKT